MGPSAAYSTKGVMANMICLVVISMISKRLSMVLQKRNLIAEAEKAQLPSGRRLSGDMTPRSARSHGSS